VRRILSALLLVGALALLAVPEASAQYCSFGPGRGFYTGAFGTPVYGEMPYAYYPYYPLQSYGSYYPYYGAPLYGGFGGYGGSGAISVGGPATYPYYPFSGSGYYPYPAGVGFGSAQPYSVLASGSPYVGNGLPVGFGGQGFGIGGYPASFSTTGYGGYAC
jgi:hypothetical protein